MQELQENGTLDGFEFQQYPEQSAWQIRFTKSKMNIPAHELQKAETEFVENIEKGRVH